MGRSARRPYPLPGDISTQGNSPHWMRAPQRSWRMVAGRRKPEGIQRGGRVGGTDWRGLGLVAGIEGCVGDVCGVLVTWSWSWSGLHGWTSAPRCGCVRQKRQGLVDRRPRAPNVPTKRTPQHRNELLSGGLFSRRYTRTQERRPVSVSPSISNPVPDRGNR